MPHKIEFEARRGYSVARITGMLTEREVLEAIDSIVADTKGAFLHHSILNIIDPQASLSGVDADALRRMRARIAEHLVHYPAPAPVKSAFVAPAPLHRSVILLWKAILEAEPDIDRNLRVFTNEEDAVAWLEGEGQRAESA